MGQPLFVRRNRASKPVHHGRIALPWRGQRGDVPTKDVLTDLTGVVTTRIAGCLVLAISAKGTNAKTVKMAGVMTGM